MIRIFATTLAGLALSGCAVLTEAREDEMPDAAEMGAAQCEPAGPHDATAPGEWVCDGATGNDRVRPRHRVEN
jgi:hypothetical protein